MIAYFVPAAVLTWLVHTVAGVPPQAWVWARFLIIIWGFGTFIVGAFRVQWRLENTDDTYSEAIFRSFLFGLAWPLYGSGIAFALAMAALVVYGSIFPFGW